MKGLLIVLLALCAGCSRYCLPVETVDHPANTCAYAPELTLSPILDFDAEELP